MSQELKNRTKKFALDVIGLCARLPHLPETRHAIDQLIRSSSSVAANYRSACRGKSKADFIAKLGIVEEEADESGFWLEMLRDVCELLSANSEPRTHHPLNRSRSEIRHSKLDLRTSQELARLLDETDQLVAITVASRKTARASDC
jgi:four helix bundle protein